MQRSPQEIKDALLKALDQEYNVINMPVVVEIIGTLERTHITKEALETTRLGKYINELRRKTTNESVAKRAKDLVRKWRDMIVPEAAPSVNGIRALHKGQLSPGLPARRSQPASPAISPRVSSLSPETKLAEPAVSSRLQGHSPQPSAPQDNGIPSTAPRGRGRPPKDPSSHTYTPSTPPAHTPRPRGRPPKNKNKHKRVSSDLVPKTSPANKRLRKTSPDPPPRVNGISDVPLDLLSRTKVKTTRELLQSIQQESSLDHLRSRTLTSLGVTRGVAESLSSKSSSTITRPPPSPPSNKEFLSRKKVKHESIPRTTIVRPASPPGSDVDVEVISGGEDTPVKKLEPEPVVEKKPESIEELYARLPPIDPNAIDWTSEEIEVEEEDERVEREVTAEDVRRVCETHIECVNGNDSVTGKCPTKKEWEESPHGLKVGVSAVHGASQPTCNADCKFREWHETLSRPSYQGELLHILPYVIID